MCFPVQTTSALLAIQLVLLWLRPSTSRGRLEICFWLPPFCKQNLLLFIQPRWQLRRTYFFNHYNVLFLHSPSKSNTKKEIVHKFLALFWYVCILRLTISTPHMCRPTPISLLFLGSVFSDCVVFYGDYYYAGWDVRLSKRGTEEPTRVTTCMTREEIN